MDDDRDVMGIYGLMLLKMGEWQPFLNFWCMHHCAVSFHTHVNISGSIPKNGIVDDLMEMYAMRGHASTECR